jgi:hypothetical protein
MKNLMLFEDFPTYRDAKGGVKIVYFSGEEIDRYERNWNSLNIKYHQNDFFTKIWNKMKRSKSLTKGQWDQLKFLFDNGQSMYDAGVLPKNY